MDTIAKQEINKIILDTIDDTMMLLGNINKEGLNGDDFIEWYQENYKAHQLDTLTIKEINKEIKDVRIKVFMGTWCSDSQREVPAFYKIFKSNGLRYHKIRSHRCFSRERYTR